MLSNINMGIIINRNKGIKQKQCKFRSKTCMKIITWSIMVMEAKAHKRTNLVQFDTDSSSVGINNRCTGCISHVAKDCIGQLHDSGKSIIGFGGTRTNVKVGTVLRQ